MAKTINFTLTNPQAAGAISIKLQSNFIKMTLGMGALL